MGNFKEDLNKGKKAENYICNFLHHWYPTATVFEGKNKGYDIDIPEIEEQMEVKYDRMSKDTGNLAIEFEFNGSPSGVNATTSKRWCILFAFESNWNFAFVEIDTLKKMCIGKRVVKGGDGWLSQMYLLPVLDVLENPFIKVHPLVKADEI